MRQRLILVLVRGVIAVLISSLSALLLVPAADAASSTYDNPVFSYDLDLNYAGLALGADSHGPANRPAGAMPPGFAQGADSDFVSDLVAPTSALDETAQLALPSGRFTNGNFAPGKLDSHYLKHADEYGAIGIDAYLARARSLLSTDVGNGIRGFTRTNGDVVRFNVRTGEFAAGAADGTIRTLFRPDDGLAYYLKQVPK